MRNHFVPKFPWTLLTSSDLSIFLFFFFFIFLTLETITQTTQKSVDLEKELKLVKEERDSIQRRYQTDIQVSFIFIL